MRLRRGGPARAVLVPALLVALVACGGVTGTAQPGIGPTGSASGPSPSSDDPEPGTSSTAAPSDTVADPTGEPQPTEPSGPEPLTELDPVTEDIGRWLESRRIANQMPSPTSIDPSLTIQVNPTQPLQDNFNLVLDEAGVQVVQNAGGMQAGFVATRRTLDDSAAMVLMVLEFATQEQAAEVAAQLPLTDPEHQPLTPTVAGAVIARNVRTDTVAVEATVATGTLLQYVYVSTLPDVDGQPLAEKALTAVVDAMAGFRITPAEERIALPDDRDGLVAHTLGGSTRGSSGWYAPSGALQYQYDHVRAASTFDRAGVDLVVVGAMNVYRASAAPGARLIQADFLSETSTVGGYPELDIDGLPDSTSCLDAGNGSSYCVGTVGRYAFEFTWEERDDVVQIAQKQQNLLEQL